jgi:uncharacterized protein
MQLRERLRTITLRERADPGPPPAVLALPPAIKTGDTAWGKVYYRDHFWPLDHRHGDIALEAALSLAPQTLERLAPGSEGGLARAAFIDIETSGLSGGAGTFAFLVGVGTFEALGFRLRQFFLADVSAERAMLTAVAETVDRCDTFVSYNGKSFDLPQIATRFALNRLPAPGDSFLHIDLLHAARRLYGHLLPSCRLSIVEQELLAVRRYGDVPGWLIPGLYFAYVRRQDAAGLHPVFEHNALDVLSLVTFAAHLDALMGDPGSCDARQLLALARWDGAAGRVAESAVLYESAWRADPHGPRGGAAILQLCRVKARSDWSGARDLWLAELRATGSPDRRLQALLALARIAEHQEGKPALALDYACQAERLCRTAAAGWGPLDQIHHRMRRLEHKLRRRG